MATLNAAPMPTESGVKRSVAIRPGEDNVPYQALSRGILSPFAAGASGPGVTARFVTVTLGQAACDAPWAPLTPLAELSLLDKPGTGFALCPGMSNTKTDNGFDAYYAAVAADEAYSAELIRVYGKAKARVARYSFAPHADPACQAARERKLAADRAHVISQINARARDR
jgi:hypothetical protein